MPLLTKKMGRAAAAAAIAVLSLAGSAWAEGDLARRIPSDAVFAAWTNNYTAVKGGLAKSPYGQLWNDPASDKLRAEIGRVIDKAIAEDMTEEEAVKFRSFLDSLKGGMALYVKPASADGSFVYDADSLSVVGLLEVDETAKTWIQANLDPFKEKSDVKKDSYTVGDVTVFRQVSTETTPAEDLGVEPAEGETPVPSPTPTVKTSAFQYAYVGNYFVFTDASGDTQVKESIALLKDSAGDTKSLRDGTLTTLPKASLGASDDEVTIYLDVHRAVDAALKQVAEKSQMPANVQAAIDNVGIKDLDKLTISIRGDGKGLFGNTFLTTTTERHGLVKAYVESGTDPVNMLKYAPGDAMSASSFALDLGKMYDAIMAIADQANPGSTNMVNMMLLSQQSTYGVDLLGSIVRNISGEHAVIQRQLDAETKTKLEALGLPLQESQAVYLGVKNGDQVVTAFKTLIANVQKNPEMAAHFKAEEKDGITIITLPTPQAEELPLKPAFAISKDALVFTNNEAEMQNVLRALTDKLPEKLVDKEAYKASREAAPKDGLMAYGFTSQDGMTQSLDIVKKLIELGTIPENEDFKVTADMIPSSQVAKKYLGSADSALVFKGDVFHMTVNVLPPSAEAAAAAAKAAAAEAAAPAPAAAPKGT